ncbi:MAG: ATP-binding protein [Planctomycetota bacterium]
MEYRVPINAEHDVTRAVLQTKRCAAAAGFDDAAASMLATVASELARNIVKYARTGEVVVSVLDEADGPGVQIVAADQGPGIEDVEQAMQESYSSGGTLGLGLPGVKRMVDDMRIDTAPGHGTTVTVRKILP